MNKYSAAVLTTSYFPPASYFAVLSGVDRVYLEACENYQRQTYRNRCTIVAANGVESLSVPVERGTALKTPIRELRIAYHMPWQNKHFRAIESAYRRSPFFEYYVDDLRPFFEQKTEYLFDYNSALLSTLCELIQLSPAIEVTSGFQATLPPGTFDGRGLCQKTSPEDAGLSWFRTEPYEQVFSLRHGFRNNLSILDVLFHLGPDTKPWLQQCNTLP